MLDFSKTFCDLHPNELISNFCSKEQCLVGLCATCICSHTESHTQKKTSPDYQNIRTTYAKMQENIRERINGLEGEKQRINSIIDVIHSKRKHVNEAIEQARDESIDFIHKFYDAKQKEMIRKIEAEQKKLGLHNQNRMDSLLNLISRDLSTLFSSAQELNSQNFLQSYQRIKTQVLANSLEMQKEISSELTRNQNYQTHLTINPMYINEVKNGLEKSLSLSFVQSKIGNAIQKNIIEQAVPFKESSNRQSRIRYPQPSSNQTQQNQNISMSRCSQSQPKMNSSGFQNPRVATSFIQPSVNQFFASNNIQMSNQSTPNRRSELPFYNNSAYPITNTNSRIEFRGNSSDKCIKENAPKYFTNHLETNYSSNGNQNSQYSLFGSNANDMSKKIRKSGLTVVKNLQNNLSGKGMCS